MSGGKALGQAHVPPALEGERFTRHTPQGPALPTWVPAPGPGPSCVFLVSANEPSSAQPLAWPGGCTPPSSGAGDDRPGQLSPEHPSAAVHHIRQKQGTAKVGVPPEGQDPSLEGVRGACVAQAVERQTSAQVVISRFTGSCPASGSARTVQNLLRVLRLPLSLPLPLSHTLPQN